MKEFFDLSVPKGTIIWGRDGSRQTINDVPENVFELWKKGSRCFSLTRKGLQLFEGMPAEEVKELKEVREKHGREDAEMLEGFLNEEPTKEEDPDPETPEDYSGEEE